MREERQEGQLAVESAPTASRLPLVAVLIGLWAVVPPYIELLGKLEVKSSTVEFVDHALPGLVVMAVAAFGYFHLRSAEPSQLLLFVSGATITLAGLWMVSTHVPLVGQARDGIVPGKLVAWHGLPGLAVTLLGLVWCARFWGTEDDEGDDLGASGR